MKSTAEKRGVAWGETVDALSKSGVCGRRRGLAAGLGMGRGRQQHEHWRQGIARGSQWVSHQAGSGHNPSHDPPVLPRPRAEVYQIKEEIEDKAMVYPSYYTVPFHGGWTRGGLLAGWLAGWHCTRVQAGMPAGRVQRPAGCAVAAAAAAAEQQPRRQRECAWCVVQAGQQASSRSWRRRQAHHVARSPQPLTVGRTFPPTARLRHGQPKLVGGV